MKTQGEIRKWLKFTNRLHSLFFRQSEPLASETLISAGPLNIRLAQDLQRRRIRKIIHSVLPLRFKIGDHYIFDMNNYPSTIQEMSLDLSQCTLLTGSRKPMSQYVSMHKFSLLTRLELLFPLETENALTLLKTIQNPQLLTSLGLYLKNDSPKYDEPDLTPIFDFIVDCPELEKLDLRMTHFTNKLELLSRLHSQSRLKILNLWLYARTDKHLHDLGAVISSVGNLESLDITVDFISDSIYKKTFSEFYQGISQLPGLKKLRLEFTSTHDVKIKPAYSELVNCLDGLSQLEELSFDILDMNLHLEFPSVLKGLNKIAHQLKKFSMDFIGNYFSGNDEIELMDVLVKMKRLRELGISRFSFKQSPESLLKFKEVLEGLEGLKKITWTCFDVSKEGSEVFFDLVRSVLAKRGVEECKFIQNYEMYLNEKKKILFDKILERNPKLQVAEIRASVILNNWYHYPFETCKYS